MIFTMERGESLYPLPENKSVYLATRLYMITAGYCETTVERGSTSADQCVCRTGVYAAQINKASSVVDIMRYYTSIHLCVVPQYVHYAIIG